MKEMRDYLPDEITTEILYKGVYKDHNFCICNLCTHPTAYVENKLKHVEDYYDKRFDDVRVHYGFTYIGKNYWDKEDELEYLGWDYAHYGDYTAGFCTNHIGAKFWTTEEIYEEVKNVIDDLIKIETKKED